MSDIPAPDDHDSHGAFLANLRYLLGTPEFTPAALDAALAFGEAAARAAWESARDQTPAARLLVSLQAAAEALEGLAVELAEEEGGEAKGKEG